MNVEIQVGDLVYELDVEGYSMETRPTRHDPGDGGEVSLGNIVKVWDKVHYHEVTTFAVFLLDYASTCGVSMLEAERAVHDEAYDQVCEQLSDAYDESRMSYSARDY